LERDDDRSWHKFRIAVKEVRYQAESARASANATPDSAHVEIIEGCRELQTLLGGWHDCVAQLHMLDSLEDAPENDALRTVIEQRRVQRLAEIQAAVAGHSLFAPRDNSSTSARSRSLRGS
jgi:CHAD domain-containing protein